MSLYIEILTPWRVMVWKLTLASYCLVPSQANCILSAFNLRWFEDICHDPYVSAKYMGAAKKAVRVSPTGKFFENEHADCCIFLLFRHLYHCTGYFCFRPLVDDLCLYYDFLKLNITCWQVSLRCYSNSISKCCGVHALAIDTVRPVNFWKILLEM